MRLRSAVLITFFSCNVLAIMSQDRWKFGLLLHPGVSKLRPQATLPYEDVPKLSYEMGGLVLFSANNLISIETGLSLSFYRFYRRDYSPLFPGDVDPQGQVLLRKSYIDNENDITYLQVPLAVRVHFASSNDAGLYTTVRTQLYVNLGESLGAFLIETGQQPRPVTSLPINFGETQALVVGAGVGYQIPLRTSWRLTVEPNIAVSPTRAILSQVEDRDLYLWIAGLRVSLSR